MNTALWLDQDVCFQPDPEHISATPPRIDFGKSVSDELLWLTAIEWVTSHRGVILKAGAPLLRAQMMAREDLLQTAHIIAFEQCRRVIKEGKLEDFVPLFFSHLRGTCLAAWQRHHNEMVADLDWDNLPDPNPVDIVNVCDGIDPRAEREKALNEALELMTDRQKEIMRAALGLEERRGGLGIREAALWFETSHVTIINAVDDACRRVAKGKPAKRQGLSPASSQEQAFRELTILKERYSDLVKENLSLRRQLGRPVING